MKVILPCDLFIYKQGSKKRINYFHIIFLLTFIFILLLGTNTVNAETDNNKFSLWIGPSEFGENFIKIRGYCSKNEEIAYYSMHIAGYEGNRIIEERILTPRKIPEFNIKVNTKRQYKFTMTTLDIEHYVLHTSETLKVPGNRYVGYQKKSFAPIEKPFKFSQQRLRQKRSNSGLNVVIEEIQLDTFPYINILLNITNNGQQLDGLTANNFTIFENGLAPSTKIEVIPPQLSSVKRIADFAFIFDHSGSMDEDLQRLRNSIGAFVSDLEQSNIVYNLAFIPYEEQPIIYQSLTSSVETFLNKVDTFLNNWPGGSDENVFLAIQTALSSLSWRPGAQKTILVFTDEDDDAGGPTLQEINQQLMNAQATVYPIVDTNEGHAGYDFCNTNSVSHSTGGRCYDIYSPNFNDILDDISQTVSDKYIIKYKTPNLNTQDVLRSINITVKSENDSITLTDDFDLSEGNEITTSLLPETKKLSEKPRRKNKALTLYCKITFTDQSKSLTANLHYKNSNTDFQSTQMVGLGSDIYSATIPPAEVIEPYVYYYISVSDDIQTVTIPMSEASQNPFVITILPNIPPKITHTPMSSALEGDGILIEAFIEDNTMLVSEALLKYRKEGEILYNSVSMSNTGSNQYEAEIPGTSVESPGIEYLIYAVDDYGSSSSYGTEDAPVEIFVHSPPTTSTEFIDIESIRVWGDQFTGDYTGNECQGDCTVSGSIKMGVLNNGNATPLISVDSYIEINANTKKIISQAPSHVNALQIKRNVLRNPEDIPLWNGTFEIDTTKPALKLVSGQSEFKYGIRLLFQKDSEITMTENELVFHDIFTEVANFMDLLLSFSEFILDQKGTNSTGYIKLSLNQILGLTNAPHSGCCSHHKGVKGCAGFLQQCNDGSISGCGCVGIGNAYLSDLEFEWDFVKEAFYMKGSVDLKNGLKLGGLGIEFGFLYDPVYLDRIGFTLKPGEKFAFTIPPGPVGFKPKSMNFLLDNISRGFNDASYTLNFTGSLRDKFQTLHILHRNLNIELMEASLGGVLDLNDNIFKVKGTLNMINAILKVGNATYTCGRGECTFQGELNLIDLLKSDVLINTSIGPGYGCNSCFMLYSDLHSTLQFPQYMEGLPLVGSAVAGKKIADSDGALNLDVCWCKPIIKKFEISQELSVGFINFGLRFNFNPPFGSLLNPLSSTYFMNKEYAPRLWVKGYKLGSSEEYELQLFRKRSLLNTVHVHDIEVLTNQKVLLIVVNSDYGAAFFDIVCPDGTTYHPEDCPPQPDSNNFNTSIFMRNTSANEAYYAINNAPSGIYSITITNANELGNYSVDVMEQNDHPEINIIEPSSEISANPGDLVEISWSAQDPDDNANICLFYDTDNSGLDGRLISCDFKEDDPINYSNWTIPDDLYGKIYIYAIIDDGNWAPASTYSQGSYVLPEQSKPSIPDNISIITDDGYIQLTWTLNDPSEDVNSYKIYLKDNEDIHTYIVNTPPFELDILANNRPYEISLNAINAEGVESDISQSYRAILEGSSQDGPPDLTIDSNAEFSLTQVIITVNNISDYKAYAYKVSCYYGMIESSSLFATSSEGELDAQSSKVIVFPWQQPDQISYCDSHEIYCQISDVYINELNKQNNVTVIENTLEIFTKAVSVDLFQGWNLVSIPYEPDETSIDSVFASAMDQIISVWTYDNNKWYMYYPEQPGFSDLSEIHSGKGYWIFVDEDATVCSSSQTITEVNLLMGWNLIGIPGNDEMTISEALSSIDGKYITLWVYINGTWDVYDPEHPEFSNSFTSLKPGIGYWIHTKEACQLTFP